jgi:hypothetical protein
MGYGANNPRTNIGYVVSSNFEFIKGGLDSFARINTNGRWLLMIDGSVDTIQVSNLLNNAWSTYNMLNILLVHQTTGFFYDPFAPELVQLDLSSDSVNLTRFEARTKNVRRFPLKIEAVSRRLGYDQEDIFHVYDNLLDYAMRYINAQPEEITSLPVIYQMGAKSAQGEFIGAHKRINGSAIELSVVSQPVVDLGQSNVAYLYSTGRINNFYVVKNRPLQPKIIDLRVWDERSEIVKLFCLSLTVIIWFMLEQCGPRHVRHRHGLSRVVTDYMRIIWGSSIRLFNREQTSIRIIVWVLLFYSLILNSTYQGQITTKLSTPRDIENIKNLKELLATNYSLFSAFSSLQFMGSSSRMFQQLAENIFTYQIF